jgi:hypothetical protein
MQSAKVGGRANMPTDMPTAFNQKTGSTVTATPATGAMNIAKRYTKCRLGADGGAVEAALSW